jgi:hypothetical protein
MRCVSFIAAVISCTPSDSGGSDRTAECLGGGNLGLTGFLVVVVGPGLRALVFFHLCLLSPPLLSPKRGRRLLPPPDPKRKQTLTHTDGVARDLLRRWRRPAPPEKAAAQVRNP